MSLRGRSSPGASASNSSSTRSAQSAAHPATSRRSLSLRVCGDATPPLYGSAPPPDYLPPSTLRSASAIIMGDELARRSTRSEEHTSELQSRENLVCRLLLE